MPTGPAHQKIVQIPEEHGGGQGSVSCRCMVGVDHDEGDDFGNSEALSPWDAEDIWLSSGMDEDYDMR